MSEDNPTITISYEGGMQFVAENSTGCQIPVEPAVSMGGSGKVPNPVDFLITALGSCIGIVMIMGFSEKGLKLDSFTMKVNGTKSEFCECFFEKLHLVITLSGDVDDRTVAEVVQDTMTHTCPIATMFRKTMEITWEHHIMNEILAI
jgi:putative redox protein